MKPNRNAVGIDKVIAAELDDIANRRGDAAALKAVASNWKQECHDRKLFGVSVSGGGIRSATFGLGVLQGLAERDLLPKTDYLSTVSGGGYIGAWLQGVVHRREDASKVLTRDVPGSPTEDPIAFLRNYSDYLSLRSGLSLDAVVIPIIWLRNTLLNQAIIVAAFLAGFLLLMVPGAATRFVATHDTGCLLTLAFILVVVFSLAAIFSIGYNLRKIEEREFEHTGKDVKPAFAAGQGTRLVGNLVVLPLLLAVVFLLPLAVTHKAIFGISFAESGGRILPLLPALAILWILLALLQWRGGFVRCCELQGQHKKICCWLHVVWMSGLSAAFMLLLFVGVNRLIDFWGPTTTFGAQNTVAWAVPLDLVALMASVTLLIGLMGRDFPDASREWLARAGALLWTAAFAWAALFAIAVFSPYLVVMVWLWKKTAIISGATAWIASTASSVLAGKSGKAASAGGDNAASSASLDRIARYGPFIAVPGFLVTLSFALQVLLRARFLEFNESFFLDFHDSYWNTLPYSRSSWPCVGIVFAAAVATFVILSLRVNINEFSMHHFYKNRLVRCFLGASAAKRRQPDSFTGFDPQDDIPLGSLRCTKRDSGPVAPYPILNATLTVTAGSELATQERKAIPWIFTPRYSGFPPQQSAANKAAAATGGASTDAYVDTSQILGGGMRLGTAMAISGAALNPGDGFHSAPQTAFLMTLFDVRLGWWIGNPRDENTYRRTGPRFALFSLFDELIGSLNDRSAYLNLSDGGNFENLGLYELVRRRCRYIIAVDGEQDPDYVFPSLGAAVRKCREDFGIEIEINPQPIVAQQGISSTHCVLGQIHYPKEEGAQPGWLLYIKASITGDEPADVDEYRREHSDFPQQSTAEQFFLESQFESYRRLGLHEARTTFGSIADLQMEELFERLASRWQVPPKAPQGALAPHADEYSRLIEKLANSQALNALDSEILPNFPADLPAGGPQRSAFFFRRQLLELIEVIFLELHFASSHAWNHPANAGWKRVFEYWASQAPIQELWNSQKLNFGKPFQHFFDDLINGRSAPPSDRHL